MVHLRAGEHESARELFGSAHEHGFTPLPGLAELRLSEGDATEAEQLLLSAIVENAQPLERAKYLPDLIEAELKLGRLSDAATFLAELEETAELCHSTAMQAEAADLRAAIALVEQRPSEAVTSLQLAIRGWTSLQMPYEVARSRLQLAEAYRASGNEAAAQLEAETATTALTRLGVALRP